MAFFKGKGEEGDLNMAKDRVYYRIDSGSPPHLEEIKLLTTNGKLMRTATGKTGAILYRYGRPLKPFFLTSAQLAKVKRKKGVIAIKESQVQHFQHVYGN